MANPFALLGEEDGDTTSPSGSETEEESGSEVESASSFSDGGEEEAGRSASNNGGHAGRDAGGDNNDGDNDDDDWGDTVRTAGRRGRGSAASNGGAGAVPAPAAARLPAALVWRREGWAGLPAAAVEAVMRSLRGHEVAACESVCRRWRRAVVHWSDERGASAGSYSSSAAAAAFDDEDDDGGGGGSLRASSSSVGGDDALTKAERAARDECRAARQRVWRAACVRAGFPVEPQQADATAAALSSSTAAMASSSSASVALRMSSARLTQPTAAAAADASAAAAVAFAPRVDHHGQVDYRQHFVSTVREMDDDPTDFFSFARADFASAARVQLSARPASVANSRGSWASLPAVPDLRLKFATTAWEEDAAAEDAAAAARKSAATARANGLSAEDQDGIVIVGSDDDKDDDGDDGDDDDADERRSVGSTSSMRTTAQDALSRANPRVLLWSRWAGGVIGEARLADVVLVPPYQSFRRDVTGATAAAAGLQGLDADGLAAAGGDDGMDSDDDMAMGAEAGTDATAAAGPGSRVRLSLRGTSARGEAWICVFARHARRTLAVEAFSNAGTDGAILGGKATPDARLEAASADGKAPYYDCAFRVRAQAFAHEMHRFRFVLNRALAEMAAAEREELEAGLGFADGDDVDEETAAAAKAAVHAALAPDGLTVSTSDMDRMSLSESQRLRRAAGDRGGISRLARLTKKNESARLSRLHSASVRAHQQDDGRERDPSTLLGRGHGKASNRESNRKGRVAGSRERASAALRGDG